MLFASSKHIEPWPVKVTAQPTAFFTKTYDEALSLVQESRNYFAVLEPLERATLGMFERLHLAKESLRHTARLTQIMAWLLAQRAVQAGEITREQALGPDPGLADLEVCMERSEDARAQLPPRLGRLLDRSHNLYVRVARLDDLARRQAA